MKPVRLEISLRPQRTEANHAIHCTIFYAAYPVNWKQLAGLSEVPGIDPKDM